MVMQFKIQINVDNLFQMHQLLLKQLKERIL